MCIYQKKKEECFFNLGDGLRLSNTYNEYGCSLDFMYSMSTIHLDKKFRELVLLGNFNLGL